MALVKTLNELGRSAVAIPSSSDLRRHVEGFPMVYNYSFRACWGEFKMRGYDLDWLFSDKRDKRFYIRDHGRAADVQASTLKSILGRGWSALNSITYPSILYQSLQGQRPFRLLHLQPGQGDQPLVGWLRACDLGVEPKPTYEAVSYVWGSNHESGSKYEIQVNHTDVNVTPNLYSALRRLRRPDLGTDLWIDMICIDQADVAEKSHQVRLMDRIYFSAERVVVWLGEDLASQSIPAFELLCQIIDHYTRSSTASFRCKGKSHQPKDFSELPALDSPSWSALQALFQLDWFWRVWVVQEVTLSQRATLVWGASEIEWRIVGLAAVLLECHGHEALRKYPMPGLSNAYFMYRISIAETILPQLDFSFPRLLSLTRQFEASDPRDKIYAVLGIPYVDDEEVPGRAYVEPDYSISAEQVFTEVAWKAIREEQNLSILSSVQHGPCLSLNSSQPSWVPAWDKLYTQSLSMGHESYCHSASGDMPMMLVKPDAESNLHAQGLMFERVKRTLPLMTQADLDVNGKSESKTISRESPIWSIIHESIESSLICSTLTAHKDWQGVCVGDGAEQLKDYQAWLSHVGHNTSERNATQLESDCSRFLQAAQNACSGRRLFVTENEHIGLGPAATEVGDCVVILFGAVLPFVLRAVRDEWSLVGECYVNVLMDGQRMRGYRNGDERPEIFDLV